MLKLINIQKEYQNNGAKINVLNNINLNFSSKGFVSILGPSGCGKSTLLNIIGGLDKASSGNLIINQVSTKDFTANDFDEYRNHEIGFIFQNYYLLDHLNILKNVEIPLILNGTSKQKREQKAIEVLKLVGLEEKAYEYPTSLSGGEKQRLAIARAMINEPSIILADEPTGALDEENSIKILKILKKISFKKLVIMVTHNEDLAKRYANRTIKMLDGRIVYNKKNESNFKKMPYQQNKTKLDIWLNIKLSLKNLTAKWRRTLTVSIAGSIGIIGLTLVLATIYGFKVKTNRYKEMHLNDFPITIFDNHPLPKNSVVDTSYLYVNNQQEKMKKENISKDFWDHLLTLDNRYYLDVYARSDAFMYFGVEENGYFNGYFDDQLMLYTSPSEKLLSNQFNLVFSLNQNQINVEKTKEIYLIVDEHMQTNLQIFRRFRVNHYQELLGKNLYFINNNLAFSKINEYSYALVEQSDDIKFLVDNNQVEKLQIVGIYQQKNDIKYPVLSTGLIYSKTFLQEAIDQNKTAEILNTQLANPHFDVLYNQPYSITNTSLKQRLTQFSYYDYPQEIAIYPTDYQSSEAIVKFIDQYNRVKSIEEKTIYTSHATQIITQLDQDFHLVIIIFTIFSSISLFVSSIMIGIVMYISVLERIKEIGILRSMGARRKDIRRLFFSESFLIGFLSGIFGVFIALLIQSPLNTLLNRYLNDMQDLVMMNFQNSILMILLSVTIVLLSGIIPSILASLKQPIKCLQQEV